MGMPDEIAEPLFFTYGFLAMEEKIRGNFVENLFPPYRHAADIVSQFRIVLNWSRGACAWLNDKTDHLTDDEACAFVRKGVEETIARTTVGERVNAFGIREPVMSSIKVVAVTCYDSRRGGLSHNVSLNDQVATRRFVVHYNGF